MRNSANGRKQGKGIPEVQPNSNKDTGDLLKQNICLNHTSIIEKKPTYYSRYMSRKIKHDKSD